MYRISKHNFLKRLISLLASFDLFRYLSNLIFFARFLSFTYFFHLFNGVIFEHICLASPFQNTVGYEVNQNEETICSFHVTCRRLQGLMSNNVFFRAFYFCNVLDLYPRVGVRVFVISLFQRSKQELGLLACRSPRGGTGKGRMIVKER